MIRNDNIIENLEWLTSSENQLHAYRLGLQPSRAGEKNNKAKITDPQVTQIKLSYNLGKSIFEVSKETGISLGIIRDIIYLRTWKSNKTSILKRDDRSKTKKTNLFKRKCF